MQRGGPAAPTNQMPPRALAKRLKQDKRLRDIALSVGTMLQDPAKQIVGSSVEGELAFGPENLGLERAEIRSRIDDVMRFEKAKARWKGSSGHHFSVSRFLGRLRYPAI